MTQLKKTNLLFITGLITLFGVTCDGILITDHGSEKAQVSLSSAISSTATPKAKINDGLVIDSARILVKSVKLHHVNDEDSLDFISRSFVLTLNPDIPMQEVALTEIPFGEYDKLTFRIHKPEERETPPDPDFKNGESGKERYSIIINGSYNSEDFELKLRKSFKQKVELKPDLVINETSPEAINVTLEVDLNSWFEDEDGNLINPFSEDAEDEIEDAVIRSFRMFKDNDHNGKDDNDDEDSKDEKNFETEIEKQMINTGVDADASGEVEYKERDDRAEFKVEVEDLDIGNYDLFVGGEYVTSFEVVDTGDGIEGEVEFRNPAEEGKLELTFDPRGKTIDVAQDSTVYLTVEF